MINTLARNGRRSALAMMALCLVLGVTSLPAAAQWYEPKNLEEQTKIAQGARWLRICSSERRVDEATCNGFLMGLEETQFLEEYKQPLYCPPPRFMVEQVREIVVKFLKDNPARHNEAFARLATDAMRAKYPCRK
jgi:Rap1a immunity proteins